jgi:hypothetical protein
MYVETEGKTNIEKFFFPGGKFIPSMWNNVSLQLDIF